MVAPESRLQRHNQQNVGKFETYSHNGVIMYQHACEAFVAVKQAPYIAENICLHIAGLCRSVVANEHDTLLYFVNSQAIIRSTPSGLSFRISAQNLVTFHGIRTLVIGSLLKFEPDAAGSIEWLTEQGMPFHLVNEHLPDRLDEKANRSSR